MIKENIKSKLTNTIYQQSNIHSIETTFVPLNIILLIFSLVRLM